MMQALSLSTWLLLLLSSLAIKEGGSAVAYEENVAMTTLRNGKTIPLVGLGVGNTQPYLVSLLVASGLQEDKKVRLFDTSHVSENEPLIAEGINNGMRRIEHSDQKVTLHVVTKVWYTHLGYERTKRSVKESFDDLMTAFANSNVDLKVHVFLHWPRCYDNVAWMNCEGEENNLSDEIKELGPPPHQFKKTAWKESWKALEEMYESQVFPIESIGVSNFHMKDLAQFEEFAKIRPHILQVNIWTLFYDHALVDFCQEHDIHVQVYNVMSKIVSEPEKAPHAYHHLQKVASELSEDLPDDLTPAQVVLAWLMQHGVSVIPKTSRLSRLQENSAISLASVPELSDSQVEVVAHAVEAYLMGVDLEADQHVSVTFKAESRDLMVFWKGYDGTEVHVAYIPQGESFNETTYPKHHYRVYDAQNKDIFVDYEVQSKLGYHETAPF